MSETIILDNKEFNLNEVQKYLDEEREKLNNKIKNDEKEKKDLQIDLNICNEKIKEYEEKNNNLTNEINQLDIKLHQQENKWQDKINEIIDKNYNLEKKVNEYNEMEKSFDKTVTCANIMLDHLKKLKNIYIYMNDVEEIKNMQLNDTLPKKITKSNFKFTIILIGKIISCCAKYHLKFSALKKALNETYVCKYEQFENKIEKKPSLKILDEKIKDLDKKGYNEICPEILEKQKQEEKAREEKRKKQEEMRKKEREMIAKEKKMKAMRNITTNEKSLKF
jgi:hypothetical protein